VILQHDDLDRPWLAIGALSVATAVTAAATGFATRRADAVFVPWFVAVELGLGLALLVLDGAVYEATREQSLPWAWLSRRELLAGNDRLDGVCGVEVGALRPRRHRGGHGRHAIA
jgi:hypothetical protein